MTTATITRRSAPDVAAEEDRRFAELLSSLSPTDWSTPTELPGWNVTAIALHVLGEAESYRVPEALHQVVAGRKLAHGRALVDGMNDVQVADRAHLTPEEILVRLQAAAPKFRRFRARVPAPLRAARISNPPYGWLGVGHLLDVVYTRDRWMHSVDICRATGRTFEVDALHDRLIVADVVAEWAATHRRPYRLVLDGPAGGTFTVGDGEREEHHLDAVQFCRIVSGREPGTGLLRTGVVF
jgi:uncharacterized protein (TIGR03083 family)